MLKSAFQQILFERPTLFIYSNLNGMSADPLQEMNRALFMLAVRMHEGMDVEHLFDDDYYIKKADALCRRLTEHPRRIFTSNYDPSIKGYTTHFTNHTDQRARAVFYVFGGQGLTQIPNHKVMKDMVLFDIHDSLINAGIDPSEAIVDSTPSRTFIYGTR